MNRTEKHSLKLNILSRNELNDENIIKGRKYAI